MKPVVISDTDCVGLSNPQEKTLHLVLTGKKFDDLEALLQRGLNTMSPRPEWLLDLQAAMSLDPVPMPKDHRTGGKWSISK